MAQSDITKIEINHLNANFLDLKEQMKEGFNGVHNRLDVMNGKVLLNSEFRIKSEQLPEMVEHLGMQFNDLYSKTMRGYIKIEMKTKMIWALAGVLGTSALSIITAVIIFNITK